MIYYYRFNDWWHNIKWFFQKLRRGYSDPEIWNLGDTLAKYIKPRLKEFIKQTNAYPYEYESFEKYMDDLKRLYEAVCWFAEYDKTEEEYHQRDDLKTHHEKTKFYESELNKYGHLLLQMWY